MRFRHELKFLVDLHAVEDFFNDLDPYCEFDKHSDATHSYEIASTYYDTRDLRFYIDREESVGYRRKIRLRAYNKDAKAQALFIEIKEKHKSFVAKKRINLTNMDILDLGIPHNELPLDYVIANLEDTAEAREIEYLHKRLELYPTVIVRYIRKAYIPTTESDMRITLDTRITSGGNSLPAYNSYDDKPLCDPDKGVLEIKTNQSLPLWLQSIVRKYPFRRTRFSKYCLGVDAVYGTHRPWLAFNDYVNHSDFLAQQEKQKKQASL